MRKPILITLGALGILILAGGLLFAGMMIGGYGKIFTTWFHPRNAGGGYYGGPGMMNGYYSGNGMMGRGNGYGMMNGYGYGPGMMGGYGSNTLNATPLTIDQAHQAAAAYLSSLGNSDLKIAEVIVFDNNAYVRVVENSTGIGAFELLVDPATQVAYPEMGPNMIWNLKYGGLNHQRMMGSYNMMGGYFDGTVPTDVSPTLTVSADQALKDAQAYLDKARPGTITAKDADPFYGYYTIDILKDGKIAGMLSVNGTSGQIFLHTWHGTFITSEDY